MEKIKVTVGEEIGTENLMNNNKGALFGCSQYVKIFDSKCPGWTHDPEYNLAFLKSIQDYCNDRLKHIGYIFLNEVYDMLGVPRTMAGQLVGWVYDEEHPIGDNFVDFGLSEGRNYDFINGREPDAILDYI